MNPKARSFQFWRGLTPTEAVEQAHATVDAHDDPAMFITLRDRADALASARRLAAEGPAGKPLYGLPFAVKDNIDVAGMPTTAACPAFAYMPEASAFAVAHLEAAGAICIGKTNLDQFATGLVGVRSPYGVPRNTLRADLVPGGSSSGSATAVGAGIVAFSQEQRPSGVDRQPAGNRRTPAVGADEALWHQRRDRRDHLVPCVGGSRIHHRPEHPRRWWPHPVGMIAPPDPGAFARGKRSALLRWGIALGATGAVSGKRPFNGDHRDDSANCGSGPGRLRGRRLF